MNTKAEKQIIEITGKLLSESGPGEFTLEKLSKQQEMLEFDIFALVKNEDQIFEQLLLQLEKEIKAIVAETSSKHDSPALEFEMLFKQLHKLFKQKPYYLTVIFDADLLRQYSGAVKVITRIKGVAKRYLTELIDRGKTQKVFTINTATKILVKEILDSFQALMSDIQLTDKMIRNLKKYRSVNE